MDFSMMKIISIFFQSTLRRDLFFLNSRIEIGLMKIKYYRSPRVFAMAFDLCTGWVIFTETLNPKISFYNSVSQRYAILGGQLTVMITTYVNHIVALLYIYLLKWLKDSYMGILWIFGQRDQQYMSYQQEECPLASGVNQTWTKQ